MISFYDLPVTRVTLCNAIHNSFLDSTEIASSVRNLTKTFSAMAT